jgi:glycosyltransferase involved in cell wall biosynthesis
MKVFYDHQIFSMQKVGGVSRYFSSLMEGLVRKNIECEVGGLLHINEYLEGMHFIEGGSYFDSRNFYQKKIIQKINDVYEFWCRNRRESDLLHNTYYLSSRNNKPNIPSCITAFDCIHERFPHYFSVDLREKKKNALRKADRVICISETTREDIKHFYQVSDEKLRVIHLGISPRMSEQSAERKRAEIVDKLTIGYVGKRNGYKNFSLALKVARLLKKKYDFKLLVFGSTPTSLERQSLGDLGLEANVIFVSGPDHMLSTFYRKIDVLVFPSLYEGFGLPGLEAIAHGAGLACSDIPVFREIYSGCAEFFDPIDEFSAADAITRVVNSRHKHFGSRLAETQIIKKFGVDFMVSKTLEVYSELL